MIQAEAHHRDHAIIEQVFADWNDGPLAHLPSGRFPANAAWWRPRSILTQQISLGWHPRPRDHHLDMSVTVGCR
jgi:hypothetical protein